MNNAALLPIAPEVILLAGALIVILLLVLLDGRIGRGESLLWLRWPQPRSPQYCNGKRCKTEQTTCTSRRKECRSHACPWS